MVYIDHITIRTSDLDSTLAFYDYCLGLRAGKRPDFSIAGAWLYAEGGDYPILHVILDENAERGDTRGFDHFAFRSSGLPSYLAKLKEKNFAYEVMPVPSTNLVQVHHKDPNGITVEVNFADEAIPEDESLQ